MAGVQRGHQRAANLRVDLLRLELGEGPHADRTADAVDHDVDTAEGLCGKSHGGVRTLVGLEIGHEARRATVGRHLVRDLLCHLGDEVRTIDQHHLTALGGYTLRHAASDALGRAGDQHHLAFKSLCRSHAVTVVGLGVNFS